MQTGSGAVHGPRARTHTQAFVMSMPDHPQDQAAQYPQNGLSLWLHLHALKATAELTIHAHSERLVCELYVHVVFT